MAADRDLYRSEPVWSTFRLSYDLTPVAAPGRSIFTGPNAGQAQRDKALFAFSYGISDTDAVKAGFGTGTKPRRDHTVLDRAGIVPLGGDMEIEAITITPQLVTTPRAFTNPDVIVSDLAGDQLMTADFAGVISGAEKELRTLLIDLADRALVPFWSYGEGEKRNYLPRLSLLASPGRMTDFAGHAAAIGKPLVLPEKIPWTSVGDTREFRVGVEIRQEIATSPFAVQAVPPASSAGRGQAQMFSALGIVTDGLAAPQFAIAVLDWKVELHGVRREMQKSGL